MSGLRAPIAVALGLHVTDGPFLGPARRVQLVPKLIIQTALVLGLRDVK